MGVGRGWLATCYRAITGRRGVVLSLYRLPRTLVPQPLLCRLWQAGHTAVTVRELDALLAAAERGRCALAAAAPQAEAANELLKGTLHVLCKAPSARYLPEMKSLRLPSKALQLLGSVLGMLEGGKGEPDPGSGVARWVRGGGGGGTTLASIIGVPQEHLPSAPDGQECRLGARVAHSRR